MAKVVPLRGFTPDPMLAARVASVPYDVVDRNEARALATDPLSFLHVTKSDIDLSDAISPYDDRVYAQAKVALERLVHDGVLQQDATARYYAYELSTATHRQIGVVLGASVADYNANIVRKHELTRPDKENDRVRHIETTGAQTGKVFLVHRDSVVISEVLARVSQETPKIDVNAADGVRHRIWDIADSGDIATLTHAFDRVGVLYIADGHHRSAAASRVAAARGDQDAAMLAVAFAASDVRILPYNRVVKDLAGMNPQEFLQALVQAGFVVTPGKPQTTQLHEVGIFLAGAWHTAKMQPALYQNAPGPVESLDVSILQTCVLAPILGIQDPRRDSRIDFVGGSRGDEGLEERVKAGDAVAFKMHPTSIEDLFAIADANQLMPPKSTWFEPKLRDGLVVYTI